jgi:hypothetical protein
MHHAQRKIGFERALLSGLQKSHPGTHAVSGHDLSRAANAQLKVQGFSPCGIF